MRSDSYLPAVRLGEVMRGVALGVVEESRYPALVKGDLAGAPSESRSQQVRNRRGPTSDV
jgi:NADPH-dependent curcumin reductase CurA